MSFWWGTDLGKFIFEGVNIQNNSSLTLTCIIITLLSFAYQSLLILEANNSQKMFKRPDLDEPHTPDRSNLISNNRENILRQPCIDSTRNRCMIKLKSVVLYTANSSINYFIMLVIMCYNIPVFLSVISGTVLAHFLLGNKKFIQNIKFINERRIITECSPDCIDDNSTQQLQQSDGESPDSSHFSCRAEINVSYRENNLQADNNSATSSNKIELSA